MIRRWDLITIGNLSRNRYWGESDDQSYREAICTSTLVEMTDDFRLLVDPPYGEYAQMAAELDRRTGLKPEVIDAVFVTHQHEDHHAGLRHFPQARWLAAPEVAAALNASGDYPRSLTPITGEICAGITVISTPGHTLDHHSLRFECEGLSIVIAADAVPTRDFWADHSGFYNSADLELVRQTMVRLEETADIIIPGHDNYFLVAAGRHAGGQP